MPDSSKAPIAHNESGRTLNSRPVMTFVQNTIQSNDTDQNLVCSTHEVMRGTRSNNHHFLNNLNNTLVKKLLKIKLFPQIF